MEVAKEIIVRLLWETNCVALAFCVRGIWLRLNHYVSECMSCRPFDFACFMCEPAKSQVVFLTFEIASGDNK